MADPSSTASSFLDRISIVTPHQRDPFCLRSSGSSRNGEPVASTSKLKAEALRWTYILRSRERWLSNRSSRALHEREATRTLTNFGLDDAQIAAIAKAESVAVRMPYFNEADGWPGRIFPWEYVISAATRRYRMAMDGNAYKHVVVLRELTGPISVDIEARRPRRFVFVQSAPGVLQDHWDFRAERERLQHAIGDSLEFVVLDTPTPEELTAKLADAELDIIHFSGFGNYQGLHELQVSSQTRASVRRFGCDDQAPDDVETLLEKPEKIEDGYLMRSGVDDRPLIVPYDRLAALLLGTRAIDPARPLTFLVTFNTENSAARIAPLMIGKGGALAALGFQDVVHDDFSESFFELFYSCLRRVNWNLPLAFQQTWTLVRSDPRNDAATGSGIALWGGTHMVREGHHAGEESELKLQAIRDASAPDRFEVRIVPHPELNYSVVHNKGRLFKKFEIKRARHTDPESIVTVDVAMHLGAETGLFSRQFKADRPHWNLAEEIHVPLTATIVRSTREAVDSSLIVEVRLDGAILYRDTHRMRLLPVDQWRDNARDGQWLPSFIQPRDACVVKAVEGAQRYVRVLRDDPNAGFEGYQAASSPVESQMAEVDLQVQAIWATLLHDWRLGYMNPPPAYSAQLDSQRLRRPSTIYASRSGTCIDLALLVAACLELIDVYPVIFLLKGHALPGYWRHDTFQSAFSAVSVGDGRSVIDADHKMTTSNGAQRYPWKIGAGGYKEILRCIRERELVPLETVRLTENCGFNEAVEAGIDALSARKDFDSMLDVVIARGENVTPLPIVSE